MRLQEDIRLKQELIKTRKGEIDSLQEESNSFMKQREELEREKGQYLAKLEQLDTQVSGAGCGVVQREKRWGLVQCRERKKRRLAFIAERVGS